MDELNRLFPDSLGTVKKLYRLIQSVSRLLQILDDWYKVCAV